MQVHARRQLDRSKGLASSRLSIASKLEFLGRLALAGRFDEIGRRLIGRKSLRAINGALGEPPAREPRAGLIPPHPWRIAAFIHESGLSGAPMSLVELATELARRKLAHVQVLAPTEGPITVACRAAGLDVAIHGIQLRDLLTRRRWTTAVAHLADVIRPFTPDIVHANSVMTAPAVAAARHAGLPTLLNVREDSPDESLFGFLPQDVAVEAFQTLRTATETVFVSQASFEGWRRFFAADASHVITNALRGEEAAPGGRTCVRGRLGIADGTVLVLCVGSYCERKGQTDLVDAIESLPNWVRPHVHVAMMGEAEPVYFAHLRRRVRKLSTDRQSALSLLPAQTRLAPFYGAADIFVCCSRSESFPRVTIEAMRAGLPIITTPVSGIVEQLNSDEALFFPPGDIEALVERIVRLVEDPSLRSSLGRRASAAYARHADFDAMVDRYVQVYRQAFARMP